MGPLYPESPILAVLLSSSFLVLTRLWQNKPWNICDPQEDKTNHKSDQVYFILTTHLSDQHHAK